MSANHQKAELAVEGMTCGGCVRAVEKKLTSLAGVSAARVNLAGKAAEVDYDAGQVQPAEMAAAVSMLGFETRVK
jgi:copper chaperone CopZ